MMSNPSNHKNFPSSSRMMNASIHEQIGRHRWTICGLIFAATTINYLDRNVLGLLKPVLTSSGVFGELKADQELNYSTVVICFQVAYALGMVLAGKMIDKVGTKSGYAYSLIGWSLAAIGHAFGHHTWSFGIWRAALGVFEAGNFPAANKAVAEWFPKKERALATGIYNAGANVGAIVAPLTVPYIAVNWGWEWAFIITGAVGLLWLIFWYTMYASPSEKLNSGKLSQKEYDYIHSDKDEQISEKSGSTTESVSWFRLLGFRQTWAFSFGKFLTDPIWWFFMFWLPSFLEGQNSGKVKAYMAMHPDYVGAQSDIPGVISWTFAIAVVYTVATMGSILGGWLPRFLVERGMNAGKARKVAMFIIALFPLGVLMASRLGEINTWLAVATIAIACGAHQAWAANIFTTVSDIFPKFAVASITGIGGMAGAVGGILIARMAGLLLQHFTAKGNIQAGYDILFMVCGLAYLTAWVVMHILTPNFKMVQLSAAKSEK